MEKWREWGLTEEEWSACQHAARELHELSPRETTASAEEIAAQLAVAKAAELDTVPRDWMPDMRRFTPR